MVKLGNYNMAKDAQERMEQTEMKMLQTNLVSLIQEIEDTLQPMVVDMCDTYLYLKDEDKDFAESLWREYLTKSVRIDVNSYWGFKGKESDYYFKVSMTRHGVGCYHDCSQRQYTQDNWRYPHNIKKNIEVLGYNKEQLECLIESAKQLLAYFPTYSDGFFKCVSNRKVDKPCA